MSLTQTKPFRWVSTVIFLAIFLGCDEVVENEYGRLRGSGKKSVNGTTVLGNMFAQVGCKVRRWRSMSPKLQHADVVVWFPDSFELPDIQQRVFIDQWLQSQKGRSLVYVGRGFDAEIAYWENAISLASPRDAAKYTQKLQTARDNHESKYKEYVASTEGLSEKNIGGWFTSSRQENPRQVTTLEGPWGLGINASRVRIELRNRYDIPELADLPSGANEGLIPQVEELLVSGEDLIVTRFTRDEWSDSQVLVVTNGAFLLNYSLVNHEHRKLAWRLVDHVIETLGDTDSPTVVFLESSQEGPKVNKKEPQPQWASGFKTFTAWPLGVILLHLIAIGIVYCASRIPAFGKQRDLDGNPTADFGMHVSAMGQHLQQTDDVRFAMSKVGQYQRNVKGRSKIGPDSESAGD